MLGAAQKEVMAWMDRMIEAKQMMLEKVGDVSAWAVDDKEIGCNHVEHIAKILGWPYIDEKLKFEAEYHTHERYIFYRGYKFHDYLNKGEAT